LDDEAQQYRRALDYAEKRLRVEAGFDFNQDRDGVWLEGTAVMAATYSHIGNRQRLQELLEALRAAQLSSGALPATSKDGLTTGFFLPNGQPWLYFRRPHIAPTAWMVLAELGVNPFQ
jgi:hypothetical protein